MPEPTDEYLTKVCREACKAHLGESKTGPFLGQDWSSAELAGIRAIYSDGESAGYERGVDEFVEGWSEDVRYKEAQRKVIEDTSDEMLAALREHFPHVLANLERAGVELVEVTKDAEDAG